jgi:cell division septum initiation protein DivIVA
MNIDINIILQENEILKQKNKELEEKLKNYTAPKRSKIFYENHKEELKKKSKEYIKNTNYKQSPELIKEKNKKAYLKRKEKIKEMTNMIS